MRIRSVCGYYQKILDLDINQIAGTPADSSYQNKRKLRSRSAFHSRSGPGEYHFSLVNPLAERTGLFLAGLPLVNHQRSLLLLRRAWRRYAS
jgi:hypothetical protein